MNEDERRQFEADLAKIAAAKKPSLFDDPDWIEWDKVRWDRARATEESIHSGEGDPYFNRVREAVTRATGGESCNPGHLPPNRSEEG